MRAISVSLMRKFLKHGFMIGALCLLAATGYSFERASATDTPLALRLHPSHRVNLNAPLRPWRAGTADAPSWDFMAAHAAEFPLPSMVLVVTPTLGTANGQFRSPGQPRLLVTLCLIGLGIAVFFIVAYAIRHYYFTLNRLFFTQRHPYVDVDTAAWPSVTILVPAHNEEKVIADSLRALMQVDYPQERLTIMPINDRSTDKTAEIIDEIARARPGLVRPLHRNGGKPGKAAALKEATKLISSDIIIVFDADYFPSRGLVKRLVSPFFDPEVGATMGRVVPLNVGSNLLTRLLDIERAGGYQVDQQARMNMGLVPQYGGTVGGVRMAALHEVGGWHDDVLAEDTDLTYRLLLEGWKTVYENRAECYEEVPETWPTRVRQIMRWARGHNQSLWRHFGQVFMERHVGFWERVDGLALLGVYALSPLIVLGWICAIVLFYLNFTPLSASLLALLAVVSYGALGNFAAFFEVATASFLDGSRERIRLLPMNFFNFLISLVAITRASLYQMVVGPFTKRENGWDKTTRYRVHSLLS